MAPRTKGEGDVQARARAILHETLAEEYQSVRGTDLFEDEIIGELKELSDFVASSDTRTFCILMVSFLEDTLKRNFIKHWAIKDSATLDRYFGSNGPLSSFAQRTAIARSMKWMSDDAAQDADALRKIRNRFAHDHKVHSLRRAPILDIVKNLRPRERVWAELPHYGLGLESTTIEIQLQLRIYCAATLIASQILSRSKLQSRGLAGFDRGSGYDNMTGIERAIIDITVKYCFDAVAADSSVPE